jgi:hypothetical protein
MAWTSRPLLQENKWCDYLSRKVVAEIGITLIYKKITLLLREIVVSKLSLL